MNKTIKKIYRSDSTWTDLILKTRTKPDYIKYFGNSNNNQSCLILADLFDFSNQCPSHEIA